MSEELKPCPFCGGEARLTYSTDNHKNPYVTCDTDNCPARNPYQWHYRTEDEAISAWNHRVIATERTAKVEKVTRVSSVIRTGRCGDCGYDVIDSYKHCPNCGARLEWK